MRGPSYYADDEVTDRDEDYTDNDILSAYLSEVDRTGLTLTPREQLINSLPVDVPRVIDLCYSAIHTPCVLRYVYGRTCAEHSRWRVRGEKVKLLLWGAPKGRGGAPKGGA